MGIRAWISSFGGGVGRVHDKKIFGSKQKCRQGMGFSKNLEEPE